MYENILGFLHRPGGLDRSTMKRVSVEAFEDKARPEGGHAVILLRGLAATPVRATATEQALIGELLTPAVIAAAAAHAADGTEPVGDLYASADYKHQVAAVYAEYAIEWAAKRLEPW